MADEKTEKTRLIHVKAVRQPETPADAESTGVWDKHPDQPGGEVFVTTADDAVEVAATPIVLDALAKGRIVEVAGKAPKVAPSEGAPAQSNVGGEAPGDAAEKSKK